MTLTAFARKSIIIIIFPARVIQYVIRIQVLMKYQDDPKKCTAARLLKAGLAHKTKSTSGNHKIILNPYSEKVLLPSDRRAANTIIGIDCSWRLADREFSFITKKSPNIPAAYNQKTSRCLPPLLAGNAVNYAKVGMLTTAEAISASLFIMGYDKQGHDILGRFKWGHTFFDLNCNILSDYANMKDSDEAIRIASDYKLITPL